jgi:hypothetical protein
MQNTPKWTSKAVMRPVTGAAALHVLLLRIVRAQDAFAVYGWRPDSVYTHADAQARSTEFLRVLSHDEWRHHTRPVRRLIYPVIVRAFARVAWALHIVYARLDAMDDQSTGETDTEA